MKNPDARSERIDSTSITIKNCLLVLFVSPIALIPIALDAIASTETAKNSQGSSSITLS